MVLHGIMGIEHATKQSATCSRCLHCESRTDTEEDPRPGPLDSQESTSHEDKCFVCRVLGLMAAIETSPNASPSLPVTRFINRPRTLDRRQQSMALCGSRSPRSAPNARHSARATYPLIRVGWLDLAFLSFATRTHQCRRRDWRTCAIAARETDAISPQQCEYEWTFEPH